MSDPVSAYARTQRDALATLEGGARAGDDTAVHDMRVATRRLRATLRTFRRLWDRAAVDAVRGELRWVGEQLGAVRDEHVMAERLAHAVHAEPPLLVLGPVAARLEERFTGDVAQHVAALGKALDSRRYQRLLARLDELFAEDREAGEDWVRTRVRRVVEQADDLLDAAVAPHRHDPRADPDSQDRALHESRKAYKKGRYAVEVLSGSADGAARRLVRRLRDMQDVLGAYQDTVITREVLRDSGTRAYEVGENAFTYGLLHARQAAQAEEALARLPEVSRRARAHRVRDWLS